MCEGADPSSPRAFGSAPCSRRAATAETDVDLMARNSGVKPPRCARNRRPRRLRRAARRPFLHSPVYAKALATRSLEGPIRSFSGLPSHDSDIIGRHARCEIHPYILVLHDGGQRKVSPVPLLCDFCCSMLDHLKSRKEAERMVTWRRGSALLVSAGAARSDWAR